MSLFREVSPTQVRDWLDTDPESIFLLDVREPFEADICRIEGARMIPLNELPPRIAEIPTDKRIVCVCHHGMRSAYACELLSLLGRSHLYNLSGGMERWAEEVDPSMPRY